jgi:hypothetical protein
MTTTWRDIADQLRPEQIAQLERDEHGSDASAGALLHIAREMAAANMTIDKWYNHIEAPADAVRVGEWVADQGLRYERVFECATRVVAHVSVIVCGHQLSGGDTVRAVMLLADDAHTLTPAQARELASALVAAADEAEPAPPVPR